MSEPLRKGDCLIIAIRCDDEDGEGISAELAFDDVTRNGMHAWLREQSELRGIERKEVRSE